MSKDELIATIEKAFGVTSHDQYPRFLEYIGMSLARCADAMEAERKKDKSLATVHPVSPELHGILVVGNVAHIVPLIGCFIELTDDEPAFSTYYITLSGITVTEVVSKETGVVHGMDVDNRGEHISAWLVRRGVKLHE